MQNPFKLKTVLCGAALVALLPVSSLFTSAEAKPKDDAPAYGYRRKGEKIKGNGRYRRDDRYDRDNDDYNDNRNNTDFGRNNRNGTDVLRGVVLNRSNGNTFQVRATDGRIYNVVTDNNIVVQRGVQVRIRGEANGDTFEARVVTILDRTDTDGGYLPDYGNNTGNNDYTGTVNFVATVTRVIDRNEYRVRAADGRTFEVRTDNKLSNIQVGDQVRVSGERDGDRIRSARLSEVGFGNGGNDYDYGNGGIIGSRINFEARIISIGQAGRNAQVRGANGQTYRLRTSNNELNGFSVGDRIRVRGTYSSGVIQVTDISRR